MRDGLYRVTRDGICAGFVLKDGVVVECAPVLRKNIKFWKTIAMWVGE